MSVPVSLESLRAEIDRSSSDPYLLTVSDDAAPHCVAVAVRWDGDHLAMGAGTRTRDNAAARPRVTLLWPPAERGGYSLIVDAMVVATSGTGQGDNQVTVRPTRAVLHRPASDPANAQPCGSDCVPLVRSGTDPPPGGG